MRGVALAGLCVLAMARVATADAGAVLRVFAQDLYRTGELNGGSLLDWGQLEAGALDALAEESDSLTAPNDNGRTPLMVAAANGYAFAVEWLLTRPEVVDGLEHRDRNGLTAHDLSQLALRQTALACRSNIENPFVLVPFLVVLPYYMDRQPYPQISAALADAGAKSDDTTLRAHWLAECPEAPPVLRDRIAAGAPMQAALLRGTRDVLISQCTERVRSNHKAIVEMFGNRKDAVGLIAQMQDQLEDKIADCMDEVSGFVPD